MPTQVFGGQAHAKAFETISKPGAGCESCRMHIVDGNVKSLWGQRGDLLTRAPIIRVFFRSTS